MYLNTRIFPTSGYARVLLFMFIRRELGGTGTGCLLCKVFMIPKGRIYFASDPKHSLLHEHSITRINFLNKAPMTYIKKI